MYNFLKTKTKSEIFFWPFDYHSDFLLFIKKKYYLIILMWLNSFEYGH